MEISFLVMMKLAGSLMVFAGCTAIGMRLSGRLREKRLALMKLKDILLMLENDMCGLGVPIAKAFEHVSQGPSGGVWAPFFQALVKIMKEDGNDAGAAWKKALKECEDKLPLTQNDYDILTDFGEMLGKSDREMQLSVLRMQKEKVSAMELKAKDALDTTGKLYKNLGALFGAAAVILLI